MAAGIRFAFFYAAFYLTLGAFLPFFPEWLKGRGLSPEWIGIAGAAGTAGRALFSPVAAMWADGRKYRRTAIIALSMATLALFLLHAPARAPLLLTVLSFFASAAYFSQIPLIDSYAIRLATRRVLDFGIVRGIGSAAFILANLAAGFMISAMGAEAVLVWVVIGSALAAGAALLLPPGRRRVRAPQSSPESPPGSSTGRPEETLRSLFTPAFILVLIASGCVQGAHGFYYYFSAVAWSERGMSGGLIGALWGLGVAVEIVFFLLSSRGALGRMGPGSLLALGAGASILRWGLSALAPPLWALIPLQALHALTFAASYLGFLRFAAAHIPDRRAATAQAINSALAGGAFTALAAAMSGVLYARIGEAGFFSMALMAAVGLAASVALLRLPMAKNID